MAIYKFRVSFEDTEDIYRDIEMHSEMTFADLHYAILNAISFDTVHKGFFYDSDNTWHRAQEVVQITPEGMKGRAEKEVLADYIFDPRQRFIYRYDEKELWTFTVELIKLSPDDNRPLPKVVAIVGAPPKQYKDAPLKFKSTDEPDGRKLRKKKDIKPDGVAPVFDDEDDDDEEETPKAAATTPASKKGFFGEPDVEEEEEEVDDSDAYEHEGEEFEVEEDEKEDVFSERKAVGYDDDEDDDDAVDGDDDDEFATSFGDNFDEGDDY